MNTGTKSKKELFQEIIKALPHNREFVFGLLSKFLPSENKVSKWRDNEVHRIYSQRDYLIPKHFDEDGIPINCSELLGEYVHRYNNQSIDIEIKSITSFLQLLQRENIIEKFCIDKLKCSDIEVEDQYDFERYNLIGTGELYAYDITVYFKINSVLILQEFVDRYIIERKKRELVPSQKQISLTAEYILKKMADFDREAIMLNIGGFFNQKLLTQVSVDDSQYLDPKVFQKIKLMNSLRELSSQGYLTIVASYYSASKSDIIPYITKINVTLDQAERLKTNFISRNIRKGHLKSIHLVTESIASKDKIFMVLDEQYKAPIRFTIKNNNGDDTGVKKLHNIAYIVDAPGKKVAYSKKVYDSIDRSVFGKQRVKEYMRTNNLKKPTIVRKSEDGKILVLTNEVFVKTILIKDVPQQYQSLYIDKIK